MSKYLFIAIIFILGTSTSYGQWYRQTDINKKAVSLLNKAYQNAQNGDFEPAKKQLKEALQIDNRFVEAYLSLGGIYGEQNRYDSAVSYYKKALDLDTVFSAPYLLPYAINLAGTGRFDSALAAIDRFLSIPNLNTQSIKAGEFRKKTFEFAIKMEDNRDKSYVFAPVNLGDSINTENLEYFPTTTIDGKKLIFTRRVNRNEDFYISEKDSNDIWRKAVPLPGNINSPNYNEGGQTVSQDGEWLIFTGCNFPEGYGSCDLYISYLTPKGWSKPQNLGGGINSEFWESSPSLSPDKRDLYFSSDMPGGYGGTDIWVVHRSENGRWGRPVNLGPEINTSGNEGTPFIHADNQTLYFNSNGHPGYSDKSDLFVSRKTDDGKWGRPVNLGYPINTIGDEGSLFVSADGQTAYYSSDRGDGKGGLDIYTFQLPHAVRPKKTQWVRGKVFDKETGQGIPSSVLLTDLASGAQISNIQTDEDGTYLVTLPVGKEYAFTVRRKGYLFYSANYDIDSTFSDSAFVADIPLQPIQVGASIVLKNLFFDTDSTTLKPNSIAELENVINMMKENPSVKIQIIGYTDNTGTESHNLKLSKGRAVAVVNYLIENKIDYTRLSFDGKGSQDPIADNDTEEGKARNRRVELKVVSKE